MDAPEDPAAPPDAPEASVAARVPFSKLCGLLERVSRARGVEAKRSLVSDFAAEWRALHSELHGEAASADSFFPALRLLLPQCDKARQAYGIKEHSLAKLFIELLCLGKDSPDALKLLNFRSPRAARQNAGDFAEVVFFVLKHRCPERGALSLAQVNAALDEVAAANAQRGAARKAAMRGSLMRLLRGLSALEQKWLVRVLMKELKMGASHVSVLKAFHEDAEALFDVTQDLEAVCRKLHDVRKRLHEIDIALFAPFRPMLAARGSPAGIEQQLGGRFLLETKFDGERVQLHKEGEAYRFWSRNGLEWTEAYGPDPSRGSFTPFVHRCFAPHVRSCILDGEMMGYDAERRAFGSKAQDFDVKRAGVEERTGYAPCLLAFDLLLLNGQVLTNRPLTERKRMLEDCLSEEPGRLQLSEWREADTAVQAAAALNAAVDAREEGVMAKRADSVYAAGSRKGGWVKLKPDYVGGMMDELDLLIVGGYYGSGHRAGLLSHFLLAVAKAGGAVDERGRPLEFLSLCKVGSGYSKQALEAYNRKMAPLWRPFDKARPPAWLKLAKERPDVWVAPKDSSLVQVRASEITDSEQYATGCTLRFPRVECFREDKDWHEAMTSEELTELREANAGKLAGHHMDLMAPGSGDEGGPSGAKKRKKAPVVRARPAVAQRFRGIEASAVVAESSVLEGREFCVMAAAEKADLERRIAAAGGEAVQNPGRRTCAVVAERVNVKVRNVIHRGTYDVVRPAWLVRSLEAGRVLPFGPEDLLHATAATKAALAKAFDAHGDSYTVPLADTAGLEALLAKVEAGAAVEGPAVWDLVHEEFLEEFGCLTGCAFYLDDKAVLEDPSTRLPCPLDLLRADLLRAGGRIEEQLSAKVSHVIAAPAWDNSRLEQIRAANASRKRRFHLLDARWAEACLERGQLLPERPFALPCP